MIKHYYNVLDINLFQTLPLLQLKSNVPSLLFEGSDDIVNLLFFEVGKIFWKWGKKYTFLPGEWGRI